VPITHYLLDMQPGIYNIYRNGELLTTATASSQGVLYFESNEGGTFSLTQGELIFNPADIDKNSRIDLSELISYLSLWKSGSVTRANLLIALSIWLNGGSY
jgi:hypothetical protein